MTVKSGTLQGVDALPVDVEVDLLNRLRLSTRLMRHFDIVLWVDPVDPEKLLASPKGEPSAAIRERVERARAFATDRGTPTGSALERGSALHLAIQNLDLDETVMGRVLRVARTIADLDGSEAVEAEHMLEAAAYLPRTVRSISGQREAR